MADVRGFRGTLDGTKEVDKDGRSSIAQLLELYQTVDDYFKDMKFLRSVLMRQLEKKEIKDNATYVFAINKTIGIINRLITTGNPLTDPILLEANQEIINLEKKITDDYNTAVAQFEMGSPDRNKLNTTYNLDRLKPSISVYTKYRKELNDAAKKLPGIFAENAAIFTLFDQMKDMIVTCDILATLMATVLPITLMKEILLELGPYLIKTTQHITKYELFLKQIQNGCDEATAKELTNAMGILKTYIESTINKAMNFSKNKELLSFTKVSSIQTESLLDRIGSEMTAILSSIPSDISLTKEEKEKAEGISKKINIAMEAAKKLIPAINKPLLEQIIQLFDLLRDVSAIIDSIPSYMKNKSIEALYDECKELQKGLSNAIDTFINKKFIFTEKENETAEDRVKRKQKYSAELGEQINELRIISNTIESIDALEKYIASLRDKGSTSNVSFQSFNKQSRFLKTQRQDVKRKNDTSDILLSLKKECDTRIVELSTAISNLAQEAAPQRLRAATLTNLLTKATTKIVARASSLSTSAPTTPTLPPPPASPPPLVARPSISSAVVTPPVAAVSSTAVAAQALAVSAPPSTTTTSTTANTALSDIPAGERQLIGSGSTTQAEVRKRVLPSNIRPRTHGTTVPGTVFGHPNEAKEDNQKQLEGQAAANTTPVLGNGESNGKK